MGILLTDADSEVVDSGANQFAPSFLRFPVIVRDNRRLSTLRVRVVLLRCISPGSSDSSGRPALTGVPFEDRSGDFPNGTRFKANDWEESA